MKETLGMASLRAKHGLQIATIQVGLKGSFAACDGANIWATNTGSNTVTELRACDGALLGKFTVGNAHVGVPFGGANFEWPTSRMTLCQSFDVELNCY